MREIIAVALVAIGALFTLVAAIGVLRMPDLFLRMSATTKAATLGTALILLGAALYFANSGAAMRIAAAVAFLLITAPIAAHMIGRAAYFEGTELWRGTLVDEWGAREQHAEAESREQNESLEETHRNDRG